ncbi:hypothetical protein BGZ76_006258 [Entomortierella beljakovae]|nr:hypothetical protein BGZ76_006258 [Entomortierella beljakovae]
MKSTLACITLLAACLSASQAVTLYEHSDFQGASASYANRCGCTNTVDFNDRASSARIPLEKITFYEHRDCSGRSKTWNGDVDTPPSNFALDGLNDMISSFSINCGSRKNVVSEDQEIKVETK